MHNLARGTGVTVGSQAADAGRSGPQDIFGIPAGAIGVTSGPLATTGSLGRSWLGRLRHSGEAGSSMAESEALRAAQSLMVRSLVMSWPWQEAASSLLPAGHGREGGPHGRGPAQRTIGKTRMAVCFGSLAAVWENGESAQQRLGSLADRATWLLRSVTSMRWRRRDSASPQNPALPACL